MVTSIPRDFIPAKPGFLAEAGRFITADTKKNHKGHDGPAPGSDPVVPVVTRCVRCDEPSGGSREAPDSGFAGIAVEYGSL